MTALSIAQRLGYISVVEELKAVTETTLITKQETSTEERYKVICFAPKALHFMILCVKQFRSKHLKFHTKNIHSVIRTTKQVKLIPLTFVFDDRTNYIESND